MARAAVVPDPAVLAVGTTQPVLHAESLATVEGGAAGLDAQGLVLRVYQLDPAQTEFLRPVRGSQGWLT